MLPYVHYCFQLQYFVFGLTAICSYTLGNRPFDLCSYGMVLVGWWWLVLAGGGREGPNVRKNH